MHIIKIIAAIVFFMVSLNINASPMIDLKHCKKYQNEYPTELVRNGYTKTKYPIVLAHGLFGFDELFEIYDYWFMIPHHLRRSGSKVFITQVSAANGSEIRGQQLLKIVERIIECTPHEKVNLIGHSHGSHSIRYVAAVAPELVASVTSVGGSNSGNQFADLVMKLINIDIIGPILIKPLVQFFGDLAMYLLDFISTGFLPQNIVKAIYDLSEDGVTMFNLKYPHGMPSGYCKNDGDPVVRINGRDNKLHDVRYFSWSGDVAFTNMFDSSDYLFAITGDLIKKKRGERNDGMVTVCGSHLGRVINDSYAVNHTDEVNQMFGIIGKDNPITIWRKHANRLKKMGL